MSDVVAVAVADAPKPAAATVLEWGRNGWFSSAAAAAAVTLGVLTRHPETIALGLTLAVVVVGSLAWAWIAVNGVVVERQFKTRLFDQQDLIVTWQLRQRSRLPLFFVSWGDTCALQRGPRPSGAIPGHIAPHHPRMVRFRIAGDRGRGVYSVGPGFLVGADPLGLFRASRIIPVEPTPIRVYPKPFDMTALPFSGSQPWQRSNRRALHLPGVGLDFSGTREFRPGDSPRLIHWRATARLGTLIVKEFDEEIRTDVTIIIDLSDEARLGTGGHSTAEYGIRIAGTLAAWSIERGHRAQIVTGQDHMICTTGAGMGADHLLRIFDELASWRPTGRFPLADLVNRADEAGLLRPGGVAVVVAPSRVLFLTDVARLFAVFDVRQMDVVALAMSEADFLPIRRGQTVSAADLDLARRAAGSLLLNGVQVSFVNVERAAVRKAASLRAPAKRPGD